MPTVTTFPQSVAENMDYPLAYTAAGAGVPLLLIHGSLCDYRYWRWQIPAFQQEYRVVAPSLRGYWPAAFRTERDDFDVLVQTRDLRSEERRVGKECVIRVDIGGRRNIKKKKRKDQ